MLYRLARPFIFGLEPEQAHKLTIRALASGLLPAPPTFRSALLETNLAGLSLPNPLGMAAGFDKNAEVPDAVLRLGCGFTEIGTVTPLPQEGNPRPRMFRFPDEGAVINRLGFNNEGHAAAAGRLSRRSGRGGIVGVNIGANKDSADRIADYVLGVERFAVTADYLTVNISSPNTPGLRNLQDGDSLPTLLAAVMTAREKTLEGRDKTTPVFLKVAPDLLDEQISVIAGEVLRAGVDGLIVSNTTLARDGISGPHANEAGGLSGRPLFRRSTAVLARMRKAVGPDVAIIGVGGVDSAMTALAKIEAGADAVQFYTGMIYGGPSLPGKILAGLDQAVKNAGVSGISALRGRRIDEWAAEPTG